KGLIWAGTDDGMIQVTEDGGKNWKNTSGNIKGMPRNGWVPQITASAHDPAEAFAVVNDYRQGDNAAYLFRTRDYGRSWQRIIDDTDVWGYVLCFVQDTEEPKLMFAGTEYGLYVSFDEGDTWNRWESGYPTVSTYDMVIHPREHDLVIGTFGRAVWILDDIRPLRSLASSGRSLLKSDLTAFDVPEAYLVSRKNLPGYYFYGDAMYRGQNREYGAMITFCTAADSGKVSIEISDQNGNVIRTMETNVTKGFNRFTWQLDRNPLPQVTYPSDRDQQQDSRARYFRGFRGMVSPGTYTVKLNLGSANSSAIVRVNPDPRMPTLDTDAIKGNHERAIAFGSGIDSLNEKLKVLTGVREAIANSEKLFPGNPDFAAAVSEVHKTVSEELASMDEAFRKRQEGLSARIGGYRVLLTASGPLTEQERKAVKDAEDALGEALKLIKGLTEGSWARYKARLKEVTLSGEAAILR
ncbi:MAG: hypothetical protein GX622_09150, partial [Bacteroidales bacterium]|nr:hypothetical protein [Bacteroidales bacterium]